MNILVCNYEYPPLGGGGGVATCKCAEGWARAGHDVTVITSGGAALPAEEVQNGVRIIRAPVFRSNRATASHLSMALYTPSGYLSSIGKNLKFDIVSTHFSIPSGPLGHWLAWRNGVPNVLTIYGADIYDPTRFSPKDSWPLKRLNEYLLNCASAVISESTDIRKNAERYYQVRRQIDVIPIPYSPISFQPATREHLGLRPDATYLVSVGRLVKRKGFKFLISALAQLRMPSVHLLIIGDGPELGSLQNLAHDLGIAGKVHFLGYQPEEKKFQYLANSDLFVLSSEHEGFGIVLQEAMQVGLPIVSTNIGGQVDFLVDGHNALLVPPSDTDQLEKAIKILLADTDLRTILGENNQSDLIKFNVDVVCERYLAVLKGAIDGKR